MPYTAILGGHNQTENPSTQFDTITACRAWAESFGNAADWCAIQAPNPDGGFNCVDVHTRRGNVWQSSKTY